MQLIFETKVEIPEKKDRVFSFFSEAKNLERITPAWLNFRILYQSTSEIQEGTVFRYKLKIHGIPCGWETRIENWNPPHSFVDTQTRGPYKKWHHTHEFVSKGQHTLMTDRVEYILPFGYFVQLLATKWVQKNVEAIFSYRKVAILQMF